MALSRCPLPCFATVSKAEVFFGDPAATAARCCCERSVGSDKSVVDGVNACENQPDSLLGISDRRDEEGEEEGW